jgi:hypothetical protein
VEGYDGVQSECTIVRTMGMPAYRLPWNSKRYSPSFQRGWLSPNRWYQSSATPIPLAPNLPPCPIAPTVIIALDGASIITGGCGQIGIAIVKHQAQHSKATIAVLDLEKPVASVARLTRKWLGTEPGDLVI